MNQVRLGIVGVGVIGTMHAQNLLGGKIPRMTLGALADTDPEALAKFPALKGFPNAGAMLASGMVDAVLVATPHYAHTTVGIQALQAGLHLMVEKPISVHRADCERLIGAWTNPSLKFAAMFNQRTDPHYIKLRQLVQSGEFGAIRRLNWIITNWFRPEIYYASGGWRATWAGEGGGVLLNQCPHNLDLFQWMFGMPNRVRAFCRFGQHHEIEVEDEVTAYLEYASGATGVFITSTSEAPGTNRLEITADRGRVVLEHGKISFTRNEVPTPEFSRTTPNKFGSPPTWSIDIPVQGNGGQHVEILKNFADAILDGAPLIAPAQEGIHSVELANAMLLSTWDDAPIQLPIDGARYEAALKQRIASSTFQKKTVKAAAEDVAASFNR